MYDIYIKNFNRNGNYVTNETLVYTIPMEPEEENAFIEPKVSSEMGKAGSFEFTMNVGHPYYNSLCQMKTIFRIEYDGDTIFRGRVLTIDANPMTGNKKVHCEGDLAFLLDSQIEGTPDNERQKTTAYNYMSGLIAEHNNQMFEDQSGDKVFVLGEVPGNYTQITEEAQKVHPDDYYKYGSGSWRDSQSAWNDLTSSFGGFIRTRYQNGTCYIDWLDGYYRTGINGQVIELGENLIDLTMNSEVDNIFTAVIPVGNKDGKNIYISGYKTNIHGNNNRILVPQILQVFSDEELNKGYHSKSDYEHAVDNYGIVYHTESFQNAETQAQLWEYATDWIKNNYIGGLNSFNVTALDMHVIGENSGKFLVGDMVRIRYPDIDQRSVDPEAIIEKTLTIMGITYDLYSPSKNAYKIGVPNAILKRNYGEKKSKKSRGVSSGISSSIADEIKKETEKEEWDYNEFYDHQVLWPAIWSFREDNEYKQYEQDFGKTEVDKIERIAESWLYSTLNGEESEYGSLSQFLSSGFSTNSEIMGLGQRGRNLLRKMLVGAANHGSGLPLFSKTKVTEYGSITQIESATYAYPSVIHSQNGQRINIRQYGSVNARVVGNVPSNSTVWCRSKPEGYTQQWMPIQFGSVIGYVQSKYLVQCGTGVYNQGEGYPTLTETEKEEKTGIAAVIDSVTQQLTTGTLNLTDPEKITEVAEGLGVPKIVVDGLGSLIKMGDGSDWLVNLFGEGSSIELGDGVNTLMKMFGVGTNGESTSGLEFFKSLGPEVGQKIITAFTNGDSGVQTAVKAFFGGDDFSGINDLLGNLGLAPIKIDGSNKTIELGTGQSENSTVKIMGDDNGDGKEWVGRKPNGEWRVKVNDTVTYTGEDGKQHTLPGFVTAEDFKIQTIPSFKTEIAVINQLFVGKVTTADLEALEASIASIYAKQADVEGMLTAGTLFSGSAFVGDLYITSGKGSDDKDHSGLLTANKVFSTSIDVGSGGIRYYDENRLDGGLVYTGRFIKIGNSTYLGKNNNGDPMPHVLCDMMLEFPDIIDASSFAEDTDLEDGKIGFKFKTYDNSSYKKVNFNIADTDYYKNHVGVNSAIMPNNPTNDSEVFAGYGTNNYNTNLRFKYLRLKVPSKAGEDYDYYIGIDASGVLSDANIAETDFYKNSVGVGSAIMPNNPTNNPDVFAGYGTNNYDTNLSYKYLRLKVPSKAGEEYDYYIGIDAHELYEAGVREGEGNVDTDTAYTSGYITGYNRAQSPSADRTQAFVDEISYNNYLSYDKTKEKLSVEITATSKTKYVKLQNDSIDPESDWSSDTVAGAPKTSLVDLSMKIVPTKLYRESFDGTKFVVKSVGKTGEFSIEGETFDVPVENFLEIPVSAGIYPITTGFKWNVEDGDLKYKYTFTTTGYVKSGGDTLYDLKQTENVLDPTFAINHGKGLMGVSGIWNKNVFSYSVVEGALKKDSMTVIAETSDFTYDDKNHVYKIVGKALAGNNVVHETTEKVSDDKAYRDGVEYGQSHAPEGTINVSVSTTDQTGYDGSSAEEISPSTLDPNGFYVIKANLNGGTDKEYKKFKTGAGGTNEKIADDRYYKVESNGAGIEIEPTGSNTAMRKVTLDVAVPQRSATAIKGSGIGGIIPLTEDDKGTPTKDVTVEYDGADTSGNTTSQSQVTINAQPVYYAGQKSVKVLAVTRAEDCEVDPIEETAYTDVTVYLDNGVTQTLSKVDVSDAYKLGLHNESIDDYIVDKDEYGRWTLMMMNYEIEMCDNNGYYVNSDDFKITVNDVWEKGLSYYRKQQGNGYYYVGSSTGKYVTFRKGPGVTYDEIGKISNGGEVKLLGYSAVNESYASVEFKGFVGYISKNLLYQYHEEPTGRGSWYIQGGFPPSAEITMVRIDAVYHLNSTTRSDVSLSMCPKNGGNGYYTSKAASSEEYGALEINSAYPNRYLNSVKASYYGKHLQQDFSGDLKHKAKLTVGYSNSTRQTIIVEFDSFSASQIITYEYTATVINDDGISSNIYSSKGTYSDILGTIPNNATAKFLDDPNDYTGSWLAVEYGNVVGYIQAKYVVGTKEYNDLHPNPIIKNVEVSYVVHSQGEYASAVDIFMCPAGGEVRYYNSVAVNAAAYNSIPQSSTDIPPEFRFIQVLKGGYKAKHLASSGAPQFLKHKVRLKFTYNDGRVIDNQYYEVESAAFEQVDYTKVSRTYAKSGSTINMRSAPNASASSVAQVPIGSLVYLQIRPENITSDWAEVRYNNQTGYMMSRFIVGTPAYDEYIKTKVEKTVTSASITEVIHSTDISNIAFNIKTRYHESWFKSTEYAVNESKRAHPAGYKAIPIKGSSDSFFHSQKTGYHGYHDASKCSGAVNHKVYLNVNYSDGSTGVALVEITTEPSSNFSSI